MSDRQCQTDAEIKKQILKCIFGLLSSMSWKFHNCLIWMSDAYFHYFGKYYLQFSNITADLSKKSGGLNLMCCVAVWILLVSAVCFILLVCCWQREDNRWQIQSWEFEIVSLYWGKCVKFRGSTSRKNQLVTYCSWIISLSFMSTKWM